MDVLPTAFNEMVAQLQERKAIERRPASGRRCWRVRRVTVLKQALSATCAAPSGAPPRQKLGIFPIAEPSALTEIGFSRLNGSMGRWGRRPPAKIPSANCSCAWLSPDGHERSEREGFQFSHWVVCITRHLRLDAQVAVLLADVHGFSDEDSAAELDMTLPSFKLLLH